MQPLVYKKIDQIQVIELFGSNGTSVQLSVQCYNPNSSGATLKKAEGKIFVDSVYMGEFSFDSSIHIPSKKDFVLPIIIKIDNQAILQQGLLTLGKQSFWIKVIGNSTAKKAGIKFKIPIYYEGEQNIQL